MQLTLARLVFASAVVTAVALRTAAADGEVSIGGGYYKERSTRVVQPMIDARLDVGAHGQLDTHVLLDAITSASPASGALGQPFDEQRYEAGAIYVHQLGDLHLGGGVRFSDESDYTSIFGLATASIDLAQKNTTLALNLAVGHDDVSNEGAQGGISQPIEGTLRTTVASLTLTQILSPVLVGALTYDLAYLDGFQENAYRQVVAGGALEPERVPERRYRNAVFASLRAFLPVSSTTVIGGLRFYADNWGIRGYTPQIRVIQELAVDLDVELRYRYHGQTRADFYETIYDTGDPDVEPFLTADPKLSALRTHVIGGRLDLGLHHLGLSGTLGASRGYALVEYYAQDTVFGDAVIAQAGLVVPFRY